jgi:hypothetical protein
VPIVQYAYFALSSRETSAAEIAAILGIEPDATTIRASRRAEPRPVPVLHRWKIVCRDPELRVDEQIARIYRRLTPHTEAIAALAGRLDSEGNGPSAVLEVVRYFNDKPDQQEPATRKDTEADASNLFGWHLDRNILDFLQTIGAVLDVDEYDMTPDYADH